MENPVLTPERLAAAQVAARERLLRKQARAAGTPVAAAAPPPPRPPTLRQRMKGGGIVPLEELLARRDELLAATEQEGAQIAQRSQREREAYEASRAAFAQQKSAFGELCTIQAQLAQALGRRREVGETQALLEEQIKLRCRSIAEAIGESWHLVDEASRVVADADGGKHFGNLSYVLEAAVRYGFWERLGGKRYEQMSHRDRKRVISNRGQPYFPIDRPNVLHELVNDRIRALYRRAIDAAEAERPLQFAMLESGPFPTAFELCDLVDPEKPLPADRQFGCVLVQLVVPKRDGKGSMLVSGVIQIAFTNAEGVGKCISVLGVNGSASKVLPSQVTIPLASLAESPAVAAIVQHLSDIADEALFTDEQAAQLNEARTVRARAERRQPMLVPQTDVERQFRILELAGELWRDRNSKWIDRAKAANQKPAAPAGSEPAAGPTSEAAGGAPAAAEAGTAPAEKPKGKGGGKGRGKGKGGNGVHGSAATTPAADAVATKPDETSAS